MAERHSIQVPPAVEGQSLGELSERSRRSGWTLRSALVRYAQPEPLRAAAVMELVRRAEGAVRSTGDALSAHPVAALPGLSPAAVESDGGDWSLPIAPPTHTEARIVEVARMIGPDLPDLLTAGPDPGPTKGPDLDPGPMPDRLDRDDVVEGYGSVTPLDPDERHLLPILEAVLGLDRLGDELADWALVAPTPAPVDRWDLICRHLDRRFDELGVVRESGPPGPGRGRRR